MRIAAIDIGSNAARLLILDVIVNKKNETEFNRLNFVRLPLRLGFEVFENGIISEKKALQVVTAMQSFQSIINFYEVKTVKACATSAMRDAKNGKEVLKLIEHQTGLKIALISGDEEATLMNDTHIAENMDRKHAYLYVNVGGGSTDIIFFADGKLRYKKSIDIGTIRILKDLVSKSHWDGMKTELKANVKSHLPLVAIGSGGNINKIFSMSKKKEGKPLSLAMLKQYHEDLNSISVAERIHQYQLGEDRADVIVPALQIYINVMRWTGINDIYVPNIGLVDGLAHALYQDIVNKI